MSILERFRLEDSNPLSEFLSFLSTLSGWKTVEGNFCGVFRLHLELDGKPKSIFIRYWNRLSPNDSNRAKVMRTLMEQAFVQTEVRSNTPLPPDDRYRVFVYDGYLDACPYSSEKGEVFNSELHGFYPAFKQVYDWARIDSVS